MGDYVHLFADETERTQYERSAQYNEPYISATDDTFDAEYNKRQDKYYGVKYTDLENNMHDFTYVEYDAEIEYLESTGTQYINTGFKPNQDTRIIAIMKCVTSNDYGRLFGAGTYSTKNSIMIDYEKGATGNLCIKYGTATAWTKVTSITGDYNIHTYDYNKNIVYRDSVKVSQATYAAFQCTSNLGIFTYINGNNVGQSTEFFKGRCYGFKIYDNNVLAMDLIPVRVGNTGYMYDKVSCQLLGNSGSGNFVIGQDKYDAEIQYLESTSTQYINLNYYACGTDIVEVRVKSTTNNWNWYAGNGTNVTNYPLWNPFFGMQDSGNYKFWGTYVSTNTNDKYYTYFYNQSAGNNAYPGFTPTLTSSTVMNWYTYKFDQKTIYRNGSKMTGTNNGTVNDTILNKHTIYLFSSNEPAVQHKGTSKLQIAWFKLSDKNNVLKFDMIPVRVGQIGYMYDRVSGQLFGNDGTGQFVLGPDV